MANYVYGKALENFASANINWVSHNIKLVLVDAEEYTDSQNVDAALDDIPAGGRIATSVNLDTKTNVLGVLDCDDVILSTVSGDQFEAIVFYKDSGVESTSYLICKYDLNVVGLPFTPNGSDITVKMPNDSNRVMKV